VGLRGVADRGSWERVATLGSRPYVDTAMGRARSVEKGERLLLTVVETAAMLGVGRTTAYD